MENEERKPGRQRSAIAEAFGRSIRKARDAYGWSQPKLAEALAAQGIRMNPSQIAKIELGQRAVSVEELLALAEALQVSPARLLDWREWTNAEVQWVHVETQGARLRHRKDSLERELREVEEELSRVQGMRSQLIEERLHADQNR